jgi:hypothetical protein
VAILPPQRKRSEFICRPAISLDCFRAYAAVGLKLDAFILYQATM